MEIVNNLNSALSEKRVIIPLRLINEQRNCLGNETIEEENNKLKQQIEKKKLLLQHALPKNLGNIMIMAKKQSQTEGTASSQETDRSNLGGLSLSQ